ncbi:MAG: hypothetical protein Q7S56_03765 [Nanoarchaeota archaeon]|nr:hypothetical protein [Nanoarchaeota archaeon]
MNSKVLFLLISLTLSLSLISAVDFSIKPEYKQGETLIAKLSANFINPPLPENIYFYRNYVRVSIEPHLIKINDDYYLWAILPENNANYSVQVKDATYKEGTQTKSDVIVANFTISNKTSLFSVTPGVIYTNDTFDITVQNLAPTQIEVKSLNSNLTLTLSLKSGDSGKFAFSPSDFEKNKLLNLTLSSGNDEYEIPVYVYGKTKSGGTFNISSSDKELDFLIPNSDISLSTSSEVKRTIYIRNTGEENLTNIKISLSSPLNNYISISPSSFDLDVNETMKLNLTIVSGTNEQDIEGEITARTSNFEISEPLTLNFIANYTQQSNISSNVTSLESCFDISGNDEFCDANTETCNGNSVDAFEGSGCCIGQCIENPKSSTGSIIGWILLAILVILVAWFFFKKYRGAERAPVDLLKLGKGR